MVKKEKFDQEKKAMKGLGGWASGGGLYDEKEEKAKFSMPTFDMSHP